MALRSASLNLISLCTGGGGLDRAFELAIPNARPILLVEREAFAVANLVAQIEQRVMAPAPIWSDVRTVPGRRLRGRVDGVIGGIPCQPHSLAGKRLGREDERDLWSAARRIFVQSGAWFILIENVGGMLSSGGAERVYRDLHRLGCEVEGSLFRASEVGLPHERERLFILAVANDALRRRRGLGEWQRGSAGEEQDRGCGRSLADASSARLQGRGSDGDRSRECSPAERSGGALADADIAVFQRQPSAGEQPLLQQDNGDGLRDLEHAPRLGRGERRPEPELRCGRRSSAGADGSVANADIHGQREDASSALHHAEHHAEPCDHEMVDTLGCRCDRWPLQPLWSPEERAAVEWASQGPLRPPGPGDGEAWSVVAQLAPERLPAISRNDRFRIEIGKALAAAHGDPALTHRVDPQGPYGLRAAVVQEIAQSTLRRGSDGMATRIDELRLLGNGVSDAQGALAIRTVAHGLARRSAGAAELVRMMGKHEHQHHRSGPHLYLTGGGMTKRIARRYSDGSFNVSSSDDLPRARQLLAMSKDDDDTELVEVDITITKSFGRPKLEVVKPDVRSAAEALLHAQQRGWALDKPLEALARAVAETSDAG